MFGDLKLTEILAEELKNVKALLDDLKENLESALIERDLLKKELGGLKNKYILQKKEFNIIRSQLQMREKIAVALES